MKIFCLYDFVRGSLQIKTRDSPTSEHLSRFAEVKSQSRDPHDAIPRGRRLTEDPMICNGHSACYSTSPFALLGLTGRGPLLCDGGRRDESASVRLMGKMAVLRSVLLRFTVPVIKIKIKKNHGQRKQETPTDLVNAIAETPQLQVRRTRSGGRDGCTDQSFNFRRPGWGAGV